MSLRRLSFARGWHSWPGYAVLSLLLRARYLLCPLLSPKPWLKLPSAPAAAIDIPRTTTRVTKGTLWFAPRLLSFLQGSVLVGTHALAFASSLNADCVRHHQVVLEQVCG